MGNAIRRLNEKSTQHRRGGDHEQLQHDRLTR